MNKNITDTIKYVGVNDHDIDLFEGQYVVPNGMAYNSYAIVDYKTAIFDTVDARAESGAMAAPTFIHPNAIISSVPPKMMPVVISPKTAPIIVQATNGRWNCASSRTDAIPAIAETMITKISSMISYTPLLSF